MPIFRPSIICKNSFASTGAIVAFQSIQSKAHTLAKISCCKLICPFLPLLIDLPSDLILEIFSYFHSERQTLHSLSITDRRFNPLANALLYRNVYVELNWPEGCTQLSDSPIFELLLRTATERPNLVAVIQKLELQWLKDTYKVTPPQALYECINSLLRRLPAIWSLRFEYAGSINLISRFDLGRLDAKFMSRLRKLYNRSDSSSLSKIVSLIQLKSIESIYLLGSDENIIVDTQPLDCKAHPNHSLSGLRLKYDVSIPPQVLRYVLTLTPALRELRCNFPAYRIRADPGPDNPGSHQSSELSPKELACTLRSVERTLTRLTLTEGARMAWSTHDGSRLDLSEFSALKYLSLKSKCFFTTTDPDGSRKGVFELLPSCLEKLEVTSSSLVTNAISGSPHPDILVDTFRIHLWILAQLRQSLATRHQFVQLS